MTTHKGIAFAVYGSNPTLVTTTVLSGETKDNIRVIDSDTKSFRYPSRKFVGPAFENSRDIVRRTLEDSEGQVPIITGLEEMYNPDDLFSVLKGDYGEVPLDMKTLFGLNSRVVGIREMEKVIRQSPRLTLRQTGLKNSICAILYDAIDATSRVRAEFAMPRFYSNADSRAKQHERQTNSSAIRGEDLIPKDLKDETERLLERYEAGDSSVRTELILLAETFATHTAEMYSMGDRMASFGGESRKPDRFLSAPDELRSRLYVVPGAREAYTAVIMADMRITKNICVKGILDPKNPPFADVTACYMADEMDKRTGNLPGVVLVRND